MDLTQKLKKAILVILGTFFLLLGIIGIILPVLPTTPFLILAAACYLRGSDRMYQWMMNNRYFGDLIRNYMERRGIKPRQKAYAIFMLWFLISITLVYFIQQFYLRLILVIVAAAVTVHLLKLKNL
jgi:uncharacterized membrane protein YbaN (DUF454 family)